MKKNLWAVLLVTVVGISASADIGYNCWANFFGQDPDGFSAGYNLPLTTMRPYSAKRTVKKVENRGMIYETIENKETGDLTLNIYEPRTYASLKSALLESRIVKAPKKGENQSVAITASTSLKHTATLTCISK